MSAFSVIIWGLISSLKLLCSGFWSDKENSLLLEEELRYILKSPRGYLLVIKFPESRYSWTRTKISRESKSVLLLQNSNWKERKTTKQNYRIDDVLNHFGYDIGSQIAMLNGESGKIIRFGTQPKFEFWSAPLTIHPRICRVDVTTSRDISHSAATLLASRFHFKCQH